MWWHQHCEALPPLSFRSLAGRDCNFSLLPVELHDVLMLIPLYLLLSMVSLVFNGFIGISMDFDLFVGLKPREPMLAGTKT